MHFLRLWIFLIGVLLGVSVSSARALPPFLAIFKQTYAPKSGTPLAQAGCVTCHTQSIGGARNLYGMRLEQLLKQAGDIILNDERLKRIESEDSDSDGWTNGLEIATGTLPGDVTSHPAGKQSSTGKITQTPMTAEMQMKMQAASPLVPLHSFHPVLVHFPIALFMFGALLELYGAKRKLESIRVAGLINLLAGSVAVLGAVITGLTALYRNQFMLEGVLRTHFVLAFSATLMMGLTALQCRRFQKSGTERSGTLYWLTLLIAVALLGAAGHFGGVFVYGA